MSVHEEQSSIEVSVMTHEDTGERRIGISLPDGTFILLNIEQSEEVIDTLTALLAEIKAQPYEVVGTLQ